PKANTFFTWNLPFTLALKGTLTTVATPGILTGDLNLAAQLDTAHPGVKFLGSGEVKLFGIQLGAVGSILDLSDVLNPKYTFAFAVPSPLNPLGFLFPAQSTFVVSIDTTGLIEAPILGLRTFLEDATNSVLNQVLGEIAKQVAKDRATAAGL